MDILFVAGFSPIVPDPTAGRSFYKDALGLPLREVEGDYIAVDGFEGSKHLGIWPLADAAQSCFGSSEWPDDVPVPQATMSLGYDLIHETRTEPWGQIIARLLGPEGLLVAVCWCPWMHDE